MSKNSLEQGMLSPVNPPDSSWPGVSQGMTIRGSGIFVSTGHVGTNQHGEIVTESVEAQVTALFENLKRTLACAGLSFEHVARMTTYVQDFNPDVVETIRKVRARYFNQACAPASVMVAAGLYDPRIKVEAEIIAVVP
jgi:2-iminobutanoate/2-iminopropanoate deaminase